MTRTGPKALMVAGCFAAHSSSTRYGSVSGCGLCVPSRTAVVAAVSERYPKSERYGSRIGGVPTHCCCLRRFEDAIAGTISSCENKSVTLPCLSVTDAQRTADLLFRPQITLHTAPISQDFSSRLMEAIACSRVRHPERPAATNESARDWRKTSLQGRPLGFA